MEILLMTSLTRWMVTTSQNYLARRTGRKVLRKSLWPSYTNSWLHLLKLLMPQKVAPLSTSPMRTWVMLRLLQKIRICCRDSNLPWSTGPVRSRRLHPLSTHKTLPRVLALLMRSSTGLAAHPTWISWTSSFRSQSWRNPKCPQDG